MHFLVCSVSVLLAAAGLLAGCANVDRLSKGGVEMAQVPITENPSGDIYPGKFVWHDLVTPQPPESAGKFYEELFGWQIEYGERYAVVRNGGKRIAGILQIESPEDRNGEGVWMPSVSVADVDAAAGRVEANGGEISKGPLDMGQRGRAVLISDPQQEGLVLLRAKGGDPADTEVEIGDWLWDELWSDDPDSIAAFYQSVVGYDEVVSRGGYDIFLYQGEWRAGIRNVQDKNQRMRWVPVVRVVDPEATVQRVPELGGVVWITPDEGPGKGDTALIGDTTGAFLLIQRWPPRASEGGQ